MDNEFRRKGTEEMSDIDAHFEMEKIDRIGGADESGGLYDDIAPKGIRDILLNGGGVDGLVPNEPRGGDTDTSEAKAADTKASRGGSTWSKLGRVALPMVLAAALIVTAVWGNGQKALAESYRQNSENIYRRAFTELCDDMANMQTALGKLRVSSSSGQYMLLLDDIWRLSGSCVSLMSQIPSSHIDTYELNSFVVRIGDYAHALTKKALNGEERTDEDNEQLSTLYESCAAISNELNERLSIGDIPTAAITNDGYYESAYGDGNGEKQSDDIDKFPTLIYDGPFSESSEKREARGLTGDEVSADTARAEAERLTGAADMTPDGETGGTIPTYDFHATLTDGTEVSAAISKQGARLVWFMGTASGNASGIPDEARYERLKDAAQEWLGKAGYYNMKATYAQFYSGAAVINFAATKDEIILYNDLVKVWVDMQTETVIGADARNYLFSHEERELASPLISIEEAEARVSVNLDIEERALALIPLTTETERLCYEFKGRCGNDEYIVYIDALSGEEKQIFVIINTENGRLTA